MESILVEAGVRLFLGSWIGYIIGAAAAVSWPLAQKVGNLLITFGFNIVELYVRLYEWAVARLQIEGLGPLNLILVLLAAQAILGAIAGIIGLVIGRRAAVLAGSNNSSPGLAAMTPPYPQEADGRRYSPALLVLNLFWIATGLLLLDRAPVWAATVFVALYATAAAFRYSGALRRLKRPGLWMQLALVMMLSGFLLGSLQNPSGWSTAGLLIGYRMSLRAALVILGFSIIGVELRNPVLHQWFARRRLRSLIWAVETAFQALPTLTAALAGQRESWKSPLTTAARLIGHLDTWLILTERVEAAGPRFFLVTGELRQGKTTLTTRVVEELRNLEFIIAGLLAPGIWNAGQREGFDGVNLTTGDRIPICRREAPDAVLRVGPFGFFSEAIRFGNEALSLEAIRSAHLVVVDEVGPLELRGEGWAMALDILRYNSAIPLLLVVRAGLVGEVIDRWALQECRIFRMGEADVPEIVAELARIMRIRSAD